MAENVYEGMYIFDSTRYGRDAAGVSNQVTELVEKAGGEVLVSRLWEERRLAYTIKGQRKGTYWLTYFRVEGDKLRDMSRQCEISDDILRHLYIKIDEQLVDAILSHAQGETAEAPEDSEEGKKETAAAPADANGEDKSSLEPVAETPVTETAVAENLGRIAVRS